MVDEAKPMKKGDLLNAILDKVAPKAVAYHMANGKWPYPEGVTAGPDHLRTSPYYIRDLKDGRRQVRVRSDDGDTLAAAGSTTDEAIRALAAKIRL